MKIKCLILASSIFAFVVFSKSYSTNSNQKASVSMNIDEANLVDEKSNLNYVYTKIDLDTGIREYKFHYRTFTGLDSHRNQTLFSKTRDIPAGWNSVSGFGMNYSNKGWSSDSLVNLFTKKSNGPGSIQQHGLGSIEGKISVVQKSDQRVAFDLAFDLGCKVVLRTVALAGHEELYMMLKVSDDSLLDRLVWRSYPCGIEKNMKRCVVTETNKIYPNFDEQKMQLFSLDSTPSSCLLFTDDVINQDENHPHQTGLVFDKKSFRKIDLKMNNYLVSPEFYLNPGEGTVCFTFFDLNAMSVESAKKLIMESSQKRDLLWKEAFEGLDHTP